MSNNENRDYCPPKNELEKEIALIWEETLGIEKISVNDNFFAIGGDSIKAMEILSKTKSKVGNIKLSELFMHQTIAEIAEFLEKKNNEEQGQKKSDAVNKKKITKSEEDEIMDLFD